MHSCQAEDLEFEREVDSMEKFNSHYIFGKRLIFKCKVCGSESAGPLIPERYRHRDRSKYNADGSLRDAK